MIMKLLFASHNNHKAAEIAAGLGGNYEVLTLRDMGVTDEIPETADTLEGNALIKARYLYSRFSKACFADDTGLEVAALDGAPGVYSARYAGPECDAERNMQKLLEALDGVQNRKARFRTIVAYIDAQGVEHLFEGIVEGTIADAKMGTEGFGYDPIFVPTEGGGLSFAQMPLAQKNTISHRARAVEAFIDYIASNQ